MMISSSSYCGFCATVTLCFLVFDSEGSDPCHDSVVDFYPAIEGKRLQDHIIHQQRVASEDICQVLCFTDERCRSINFNHTADNDGEHVCEVNNSTAKVHPQDLKTHQDHSYRETEDPCASDPCGVHETCLPRVGPMGYGCVCSPGYAGDPCEATSCERLARDGVQDDGEYQLIVGGEALKVYCDMKSNSRGWTLVARFSNSDAKNWMNDSGDFWYDRTSPNGRTTDPADNTDMISPAFWLVNGTEFKITRSDDSSHTALLYTTGGCLGGQTFRSKMTSYGDFRNGTIWAVNECLGSCEVKYGGEYQMTEGFRAWNCGGPLQARNKIGFWCHDRGDAAVMTIGGAGSGCYRADHGIGVTETDQAAFVHDQHDGFDAIESEYDFGDDAVSNQAAPSYSLNLWVR